MLLSFFLKLDLWEKMLIAAITAVAVAGIAALAFCGGVKVKLKVSTG